LSYALSTTGTPPDRPGGIPLALHGWQIDSDSRETQCLYGGESMKVRYTLTMDDLTVNGEHFDTVVLDWEVETTQDEVMRMSEKWITAQDFLTRRMMGLTKVGESSLTIEPIEESVNEIQGDGRDF
jgi:hypothetical protein